MIEIVKRGFKTRAEEQAANLRKQFGLKPWHRLPSDLLAEHLGFTVITPADVPGMTPRMVSQLVEGGSSEWSAVTLELESGFLLIENPSHSARRREGSRMHEMAHVLCGHKPSALAPVSGLGVITRAFDEEQEQEADWLGRCIHLPRAALNYALKREWTVDEISSQFVASESLVKYRLNATGALIIRQRMARWSGKN